MTLKASVVIPTRNRVEELRDLLRSVTAQTVTVDILVMDDGESEATSEMLRSDFPQVSHHRLGCGRGPAFQRNRGIELATQPIVFPVDDDTLFISPHTVAQTLAEFDHPRVGAVGIPFINVRQDRAINQRAPDAGVHVAHAFVGAAHAVRREAFLKVGGYCEHFFYMGEEGDLCLRLMQAGYATRLGQADAIHHLESPLRDLALADVCGRRNDVLFAWRNVPMPWLPVHLLGTSFKGMLTGFRSRHAARMLRGTINGYVESLRRWQERKPVSPAIYRLNRALKKHGPKLLTDIEQQLPPLPPNLDRKVGTDRQIEKVP